MHILRILEIAWLSIAICLLVVALYQIFSEDFATAIFMLIGTTIAFGMYFIRKKQRIKMDQQREKDTNVQYH